MISQNLRHRLLVILPPLCWFISQQSVIFFLHATCPNNRHGVSGVVEPIFSIAYLCLAVAVLALPKILLYDPGGHAWLPWLWTGIFAVAILFSGLAVLLLPSCHP